MRRFKLIICFILCFFLCSFTIKAEDIDRNTLDNYGVNKKWNINSSNLNNVLNTPLVDPQLKIYDYSDVLTEDEENLLRKRMNQVISKINMDIVIVIKDLPYNKDSENETFASDFYDYNDFGIDYEKYDGILLFRNTYINDPYYNLYTFGNAQIYFDYYRLENILDNIYDDLHTKNYYSGFLKYINYVETYYDSGISSEMEGYTVDDMGYLVAPPRVYKMPIIPAIVIASIVTIIVMIILIKKNKMLIVKTNADQYIDYPNSIISKKNDRFVRTYTRSYTTQSSSGRSGSSSSGSSHSFHSSSGSSGGGHSSGGGRHG